MVAPANDLFVNAIVISDTSVPYNVTYDITDATTEAGEPTLVGGFTLTRTVWYQYTPASSGMAIFSTFGASFGAALAAYTGSSLATLSLVAVVQPPFDGFGSGAHLRFDVTAGTTYHIQVGTFSTGSFSLNFWFNRMPGGMPRGAVTNPPSGGIVYVPGSSGTF